MLITEAYREQNRGLHNNPHYGVSGQRWSKAIIEICENIKTVDVLDYGCGKQTLKREIPFIKGYDPCIEGLDDTPEPAEVVVCTDVLEHIEPDCLDAVLDDLKRVTKNVIFLTIATGPAVKKLPDGRNAHLIQEGQAWWMPKIFERFHVHSMGDSGEIVVLASAK